MECQVCEREETHSLSSSCLVQRWRGPEQRQAVESREGESDLGRELGTGLRTLRGGVAVRLEDRGFEGLLEVEVEGFRRRR